MSGAARLGRRAVLGGAAWPFLCAFQAFGRSEGAEPDHADDPRWAQFRGVKIASDRRKGVLTAVFPAGLRGQEGKVIDLGGYFTPLEPALSSAHFLMTRRSSGCPFCPPNEAYEAVEVFLRTKVRYDREQVFVKGRLHLAETSDKGLFFQLRDAVTL